MTIIGQALSTSPLQRPRKSSHDEAELMVGAPNSNSESSLLDQVPHSANERSWITLETMLAGKRLQEHVNEDGSEFFGRLSESVDLLIEQVAPEEFRRSDPEWRQACWQQLRAARQAGLLELRPPNLLEASGLNDDRADHQSLARLCEAFERSAWYCLRPLVEMRTSEGEPFCLALLQWFTQEGLDSADEDRRLGEVGEWDHVLDMIVELIETYPGKLESTLRAACGAAPGTLVQPVVDSMAASLRFQRGLGCIHNGDYERAVVEFGAAIQHNPAMEHAYAQRGDAHRMLGANDRAVADYTAALRINPANSAVLINRGQTFRMLGRIEMAIADYDVVLQLEPANVVAINHRGTARAEMGSHDTAIADFSHAVKIDPEYPFTYQNRARSYAARGDFDAAIGDYSQVLRLNPMFTLAYVRRGDVYRQKGELDRAVADYTEALRLDPLHLHAYVNRGVAYQEQGQSNRALSDFENALKLDNANPWMFLNRGIAYRDNGEFSKALVDFDAALRLDPDNHQVYFHRALARQEMGDTEQALLDLDEAIRQKPDAAEAYFHRGSLFLTQRESEPAISDLTEAIRLEPVNPRAYLTRALAHSLDDDLELVVDDCTRAIELDASLKRAYTARGIAYHRQGAHERALADFDQVLKLTPSDPEALVNQAVVHAKMGRHGEAISGLTRALKIAPKNARALAARASSYRALERHEAALADYAQAIQIDPRHSVAFCNQRGLVYLMRGERDLALADCALSLYLDPGNRRGRRLREQVLSSTEFANSRPRTVQDQVKARPLPPHAIPSLEAASTPTQLEDTLGPASARTESEFVVDPPPESPTEELKASTLSWETESVELFVDERAPAPAAAPPRVSSGSSSEFELVVSESDASEYEREQRLMAESREREIAAKEAEGLAKLADQRREEAAKIFKQNQAKEAQRLARLNAKENAERAPADWTRRILMATSILLLVYLIGPPVWDWATKKTYPQEEKEILTAEVKVSASELCKRFQSDAASAQAEFGGRILEVSGTVTEIKGEGKDHVVIVLMDDKKEGRVVCTMPNPKSVSQGGMLSSVERFAKVTLKGKCTGQESNKIKLDGVQLVHVRSI
jgi:tetratricopeptide (TPR) repeat protein/uncharacterized protein (DUF1330 family)